MEKINGENKAIENIDKIILARDEIPSDKATDISYQSEIRNRSSMDPTILISFRLNITKGLTEEINCQQIVINKDDMNIADFGKILSLVLDENDLEEHDFSVFSLQSLNDSYKSGKIKLSLSFWAKERSNGHILWIQTDCRLIRRSKTGEILAVFYNHDYTRKKLTDGMLSELANNSYERCAAIFVRENQLKPILELNADYHRCWGSDNYEQGMDNYCSTDISQQDQKRVRDKFKLSNITKQLEYESTYGIQYDVVSPSGELRHKQTTYSWMDKDRQVLLMSRTDIGLYERLRYLNEYDSLTGVFNRKKLFSKISELLSQNNDRTFAFYHLDIEHFNLYNAAFGEQSGNELLQHVAGIVAYLAGMYDTSVYGRLNADVFCICAPADNSIRDKGILFAQEQLKKFRPDYALKFSIGEYIIPDPKMKIEDMQACAQEAAKVCKQNFNCIFHLYDETEKKHWEQNIEISNQMQTALEDHQFKVYLQPKYSLSDNRCCGAEALVRWIHPEKGLISPDKFIPVFESNGFVAELDRYMWEQVCIILRKWIDEGLDPHPVSVNISRISLYNPQLVNILMDLVHKYNIDTSLLELEITESAYMSNPDLMKKMIEHLHKAHFTILMDDFGSGYSSLNTLKEFPIDVLKIDMKFLPDTEHIREGEIIIASVIRMAKWLGMTVIMEGVETQAQIDFLDGIGCDYIQGYYFDKPMPYEDYERKYVKCVQQSAQESRYYKIEEKPSVIIIDSEQSVQNFVEKNFSSQYKIILCSCVESAIIEIKHNSVSLIVINNVLPGLSGLDFIEYCRMYEQLDNIPKFVLVNHDTYCKVNESIISDKVRFFSKPVNYNLLLQNLKQALFSPLIPQKKNDGQTYITLEELRMMITEYHKIFDVVRIVDPFSTKVVNYFGHDNSLKYKPFCYNVWNKEERCLNCISLQAYADHKRKSKFEIIDDESYSIIAVPFILLNNDGEQETIIMELVDRITDEMSIHMNGENIIASVIKQYDTKLYTDALTGIHNRRYYEERIFLKENSDAIPDEISFILMDIQNFKMINDTYGHMKGDEILKKTGSIIKQSLRSSDAVIRIGGDEYLAILRKTPEAIVKKALERVKNKINKVIIDKSSGTRLNINAGYSYTDHFTGSGQQIDDLFKKADEHMYMDKNTTKHISDDS